MSDYHVLNSSKKDRVGCVFHYAVPDTTNVTGISLRTIIAANLVPANPIATGAELTQVQAGSTIGSSVNMQFYELEV